MSTTEERRISSVEAFDSVPASAFLATNKYMLGTHLPVASEIAALKEKVIEGEYTLAGFTFTVRITKSMYDLKNPPGGTDWLWCRIYVLLHGINGVCEDTDFCKDEMLPVATINLPEYFCSIFFSMVKDVFQMHEKKLLQDGITYLAEAELMCDEG